MTGDFYEDIKRYVGFSQKDAEAIQGLLPAVRPAFAGIVDRFYEAIQRHPRARVVLRDDHERIAQLKKMLRRWLEELFAGPYDNAYFERRSRVGRIHVLIELPPQYMFTAMSVIRTGLVEATQKLDPPSPMDTVNSLHRLLDLELAVMNETYREDFVRRIQEMDRLRFEERISEAEHLATVGRLAASLAHEIKNPLAGISGAIQVLGAALGEDHPHQEVIREALKQIDRLDAAVRDLLVYARPKPPARKQQDLAEIIARAMILLREEPALRPVKLHSDGLKGRYVAFVDETQIEQLVTNLILNAAHACESGGEIRCTISSDETGVSLVVRDTGRGMDPEVLKRAFEPFFTTKSRGTGLGLSICQRIVDLHEGTMTIESQRERGTCVTVHLPSGP